AHSNFQRSDTHLTECLTLCERFIKKYKILLTGAGLTVTSRVTCHPTGDAIRFWGQNLLLCRSTSVQEQWASVPPSSKVALKGALRVPTAPTVRVAIHPRKDQMPKASIRVVDGSWRSQRPHQIHNRPRAGSNPDVPGGSTGLFRKDYKGKEAETPVCWPNCAPSSNRPPRNWPVVPRHQRSQQGASAKRQRSGFGSQRPPAAVAGCLMRRPRRPLGTQGAEHPSNTNLPSCQAT